MEQTVRALLQGIDPSWGSFELQPMAGDASTRRYHRITVRGAERPLVLMELGETGGAEEYGAEVRDGDELPFLHVQRVFESLGLPVPAVLAWCDQSRLMIIDDLGDDTLFSWLQGKPLGEVQPMYAAALGHLAQLQARGPAALPEGSQVARQRYSAELFRWEFDHFVEFAIQANGQQVSAADLSLLSGEFDRLSAELASEPQVVVHRDYHSRNLMVCGGRLGIIDFQDALLGPATYDVASLLRDAYVTLPEPEVQALLQGFQRARAELGAPLSDGFERSFALCALQRSLKAAGRFWYFLHRSGNNRYLQYVPTTLRNARLALLSQPDLGALQTALSRYVPELA